MADPKWDTQWWAGCPEHGKDAQPSGSCHECAMLMPEPPIGGSKCDRCNHPMPPVPDDPEYRSGMVVQVGGFSLRVDDESGDSYDEPDNDLRWFCPKCWGAIRARVRELWNEQAEVPGGPAKGGA